MKTKTNKSAFSYLKVLFGIFMLVVYFGMALLMYLNFFGWGSSFDWFRYILVAVFALYGVYRCHRQVKGTDYYLLKASEDRQRKSVQDDKQD